MYERATFRAPVNPSTVNSTGPPPSASFVVFVKTSAALPFAFVLALLTLAEWSASLSSRAVFLGGLPDPLELFSRANSSPLKLATLYIIRAPGRISVRASDTVLNLVRLKVSSDGIVAVVNE
jgi:hypothetical protein